MIDIAAIEARLAAAPLECPECGSNDAAVVSGDPRKVCADCDDIVGMDISPENADLAALVARVRELEADLAKADEAIVAWQSFLRDEKSERAALRAIIEGRAEGPTNDELTAHDAAGGGWMVRPQGFTVSVTMGGPSYTHAWRERLSTQDHPARWWPLDASGRPCAWPVTP